MSRIEQVRKAALMAAMELVSLAMEAIAMEAIAEAMVTKTIAMAIAMEAIAKAMVTEAIAKALTRARLHHFCNMVQFLLRVLDFSLASLRFSFSTWIHPTPWRGVHGLPQGLFLPPCSSEEVGNPLEDAWALLHHLHRLLLLLLVLLLLVLLLVFMFVLLLLLLLELLLLL